MMHIEELRATWRIFTECLATVGYQSRLLTTDLPSQLLDACIDLLHLLKKKQVDAWVKVAESKWSLSGVKIYGPFRAAYQLPDAIVQQTVYVEYDMALRGEVTQVEGLTAAIRQRIQRVLPPFVFWQSWFAQLLGKRRQCFQKSRLRPGWELSEQRLARWLQCQGV